MAWIPDFERAWIPECLLEGIRHGEYKIIDVITCSVIDALGEKTGVCSASNAYLAKYLGITEDRISRIISKLKRMGLIEVLEFNGRTRILRIRYEESLSHSNVEDINWYEKLGLCQQTGLIQTSRKNEERRKLTASRRRKIFERDCYRCIKCDGWKKLQVDHIIPIAQGGKTIPKNLQTLCYECHKKKTIIERN